MNNRELGIKVLSIWYRASGLQLQGVTFEVALAHYDQANSVFISNLGSASRFISEGKLQTALENLGSAGFGKYPHHSMFFEAMRDEVLTPRWEDVEAVATETASDLKGAAMVAGGLGAIYVLVGGAVLLFGMAKR